MRNELTEAEARIENKDRIIEALRTTLGEIKILAATRIAPSMLSVTQQDYAQHKCGRIEAMAAQALRNNSLHTWQLSTERDQTA